MYFLSIRSNIVQMTRSGQVDKNKWKKICVALEVLVSVYENKVQIQIEPWSSHFFSSILYLFVNCELISLINSCYNYHMKTAGRQGRSTYY